MTSNGHVKQLVKMTHDEIRLVATVKRLIDYAKQSVIRLRLSPILLYCLR